MIAALAFGLLVGGLLGLVGGGGSILAVPVLVYGMGMPLAAAIPSSLVVVGASSAVAVLPRIRHGLNWRLALIIGVTGGITAYGGSAVNRVLDQKTLLLVFAAIMIAAGVRMFMSSKSAREIATAAKAVSAGADACPRPLPLAWLSVSSPGFSVSGAAF